MLVHTLNVSNHCRTQLLIMCCACILFKAARTLSVFSIVLMLALGHRALYHHHKLKYCSSNVHLHVGQHLGLSNSMAKRCRVLAVMEYRIAVTYFKLKKFPVSKPSQHKATDPILTTTARHRSRSAQPVSLPPPLDKLTSHTTKKARED